MERLTRLELGKTTKAVLCNHEAKDCNDSCQYGMCKWNEKAIQKLKAYEDAGLTPEEIKELVIDVSKGDTRQHQEKLMQMILDRYDAASKDGEGR